MSFIKNILVCSIFLILSVFSLAAREEADSVPPIIAEIEASGAVRVNFPDALSPVLSYSADTSAERRSEADDASARAAAKVGYRVQVFDDNNVRTAKQQAQERKSMIENRFPEFRAYISFNSPYWRVKVGDFRTRSEAEAAMGAIRSAFPSFASQLRVVRDKINPR